MFKFVFLQFFGRVEACESSSMSLSFRLVYGILIFTQGVQLLHPRIKNRQQNVAEKISFFYSLWKELLVLERTVFDYKLA